MTDKHEDETTSEETVSEKTGEAKKQSYFFSSLFRPGLILTGAVAVLFTKDYVSAKFLACLVLVDYMTYEFINKLPVALCFIAFIALTTIAVT